MTNSSLISWMLLAGGIFLSFCSSDAEARKKLLSDRGGSAWIEVSTTDPNLLADALVHVFHDDGYYLQNEGGDRLTFARSASRMQEWSYGTPLHPGSVEVVSVSFFPISQSRYRVECHVRIRQGDRNSLSDSEVLPLFGRQYKRMLRRAKRMAE